MVPEAAGSNPVFHPTDEALLAGTRQTPSLEGFFVRYKVYILISESIDRLYIGQTQNLEKHNKDYERSTKGRGPWKIYFEIEVDSRSETFKLEKRLKNLRSRTRIDEYINKHYRIWRCSRNYENRRFPISRQKYISYLPHHQDHLWVLIVRFPHLT